MTEAEKLHQRKMQLNNEIVKPLLTLMDSGLDVPRMLETMAERASAGKGLENLIQGQNRDKTEKCNYK